MRDAGAKQLRQGIFGNAAKYRRHAHHATGDIHAARKLPARRCHRTAKDRRSPPQSGGVSFKDTLVAGERQRAGRLLKNLRGKPVFQREESTPPRAVAAGVLEPGGDESFETRTVAGLQDDVGSARYGHDQFRRFARQPNEAARPQRDIASRRQPSLRDRQSLQTCQRGLRAGAAANIGGGVGEIGETVECQVGFEVHAHPPEGELAIRPGVDESKLQRALGPSLEVGIGGVG